MPSPISNAVDGLPRRPPNPSNRPPAQAAATTRTATGSSARAAATTTPGTCSSPTIPGRHRHRWRSCCTATESSPGTAPSGISSAMRSARQRGHLPPAGSQLRGQQEPRHDRSRRPRRTGLVIPPRGVHHRGSGWLGDAGRLGPPVLLEGVRRPPIQRLLRNQLPIRPGQHSRSPLLRPRGATAYPYASRGSKKQHPSSRNRRLGRWVA